MVDRVISMVKAAGEGTMRAESSDMDRSGSASRFVIRHTHSPLREYGGTERRWLGSYLDVTQSGQSTHWLVLQLEGSCLQLSQAI